VGDAVTPQSDPTPTRSKIVAVDARTFTDMMEQLQEGYVTSVASTAGRSDIPGNGAGADGRPRPDLLGCPAVWNCMSWVHADRCNAPYSA